MKKSVLLSFLLAFVIVLSGFSCLNFEAKAVTHQPPVTQVLKPTAPEQDALIKSRFENMLNHNYLYDDDFNNMHTVIENSCLALLDKMEEQFIETDILFPFIENAYGISVYIDDEFGAGFPKKQGAVYVVPRGFTQYTHTVINIVKSGDTFEVTSLAITDSHDGEPTELVCNTVFKVNNDSAFGYNILSSTLTVANGIEF
ncbi:MAG: hypothetical protein E7548_04790 [Ruminococcaceae bacterium]|nr:hypothetical protein [Oscillospiraceae bacterium]